MVDFDILLGKLEAISVRGPALNWFRSFVVGRIQQIKIGNVYSFSRGRRSSWVGFKWNIISYIYKLLKINMLFNVPKQNI